MSKLVDIEEMIVDAKAEEEVKAEQEKAAKVKKAKEDFRKQLSEQLREAFSTKEDAKVTISLSEYVLLKQKEIDLERIVNNLLNGLVLSYNNEYLKYGDGEEIGNLIKLLYPELYDGIFAEELERVNK